MAKSENDAKKEKKPKFKLPEGFDSEQEFLSEARRLFSADLAFDQENLDRALDDAEFVSGNQWDDTILQARTTAGKPTLTVNRLPAFVMSVVGQRRLSQTDIAVHPDSGGTKEVARVREDLIRNIQKETDATTTYSEALENVTIAGQGAFEVELDVSEYDVFLQDIGIRSYPNPLATVWDSQSTHPTGKDARRVWVVDEMDAEDFKKEYPFARASDLGTLSLSGLGSTAHAQGWYHDNIVRVVVYWQMGTEKRIVALMEDTQNVEDVTDLDPEQYINRVAQDPTDGEPMIRETLRPYAERYLITGTDILEGPYRLPINRVPVIRVSGWVINVGPVRYRASLVRFAKDPQRLHNYWRSTIAENLMKAPRAKWLASDIAVEGVEKDFRNAHNSDDMLLKWNGEAGVPPSLVSPAAIDGALITAADTASQDIKDITGIQEASLGQTSNEVSGRAILARQKIGELASAVAQDNLEKAIAEAGSVINQLIPIVYDTPRVIKVLGSDEKARMEAINGYQGSQLDITAGKYSLTISTGPTTVTKRAEAAEGMLNMVNAMPQVMSSVADLIIDAQDWPQSTEFARRLRAQLPPGTVAPEDLTDEQKQQQAGRQQQAAQQQQKQDLILQLEMMKLQGEAALMNARAKEAQTNAQIKIAKLSSEKETEESVAELNEAKAMAEEIRSQIALHEAFQKNVSGLIEGFINQGENQNV